MENKLTGINKKALAGKYKVSTKTLEKWLKPIEKKVGEYSGRMFTPVQIKVIYEHLGEP